MELARQELGEEALLVNARPATPETRYLGAYEVVFGIAPRPAQGVEASSTTKAANEAAGSDRDGLAAEVAGLKRDFERLLRTLTETRTLAETRTPADTRALSGTQLLTQPPASALQAAPETPRYRLDATLGRPGAARVIVALVGPPGVGKTTTLIKLAARYGLTSRKPARILSTDVYRIAAADQLRSLAAILGIGCDVAETAGALAQLLEEHRTKELLFVDTPGLARADMEDAADLAALLASHPEIDTHLVLPAFMRPSDMERAVARYAVFAPRKILFTRVDETSSPADMIAVAARAGLPISFLGTGQQIPEDLEAADTERIEALLGEAPLDAARAIQTRGAAA